MMVENILKIALDFFSNEKNIKIKTVSINKIIISPSYFYTIIILYHDIDNSITITSKWNYGLFGSVFFKRKKIKGGYCDATEDLKSKYKDLKKKVAKSKGDIDGTYDELVDNLSSKSEDVVSFLETKLASLKKQVAKY